MFLQTVRAAGGGEASESGSEQTGSLRQKQSEGQRVSPGKTLRNGLKDIMHIKKLQVLNYLLDLIQEYFYFFTENLTEASCQTDSAVIHFNCIVV